jgi:hypothetical protein
MTVGSVNSDASDPTRDCRMVSKDRDVRIEVSLALNYVEADIWRSFAGCSRSFGRSARSF